MYRKHGRPLFLDNNKDGVGEIGVHISHKWKPIADSIHARKLGSRYEIYLVTPLLGMSNAELAISLVRRLLVLPLLHHDDRRRGAGHGAARHIIQLHRCCHLTTVHHHVLFRGCRNRCVHVLPRLHLVKDLGHDQLPVLLLLVTKVVLVHYPVGLLRLPVLAKVGVQHHDLLAPLLPASHDHRPCLASLVPPHLHGTVAAVKVTLCMDDLSPLSSAICVGLG
jgi:hypothetical protein